MRIEAAAWGQLAAICRGLPDRPMSLHSQRILLQVQGHSLYLIAWADERPLGHVVLQWPTWPERPWAVEWQARYGCCFILDLWVEPGSRNQGIGRALMSMAESLCRKQGHPSVGLHMGLDEGYRAALNIYHSMDYTDLGHGLFIESSPGAVEPVIFLLKELA